MDSIICKICSKPVEEKEHSIFISSDAFPSNHRLSAYCDKPLHLDCIARWPFRIEFSSASYDLRVEQYLGSGWYIIARQEDWFVGFIPPGPEMAPPEGMEDLVEVRVRDWPLVLYGHAEKWSEFLQRGWQDFEPPLRGKALIRAAKTVREVQQVLPDTNTIVEIINERLKQSKAENPAPVEEPGQF